MINGRNGLLALLLVWLLIFAAGTGCTTSGDATASAGSGATPASNDGDTKDDDADDEDKEEAVPVEVAALERGGIEAVLRFSTNLEAESHVEVFSQAARLVTDMRVEEGDRVRKDQVLLRLQDDEQRSAVSKITSELAKAKREYDRQKRLYAENLISEQEFNDATYQIEQLELRMDDARRELGYTEVRAPIAGTVTSRLVKLGDQISVGQHLFDIVDFDSIVARVYVPEKHLADLAAGQVARVGAPSLGRSGYEGRIQRISPVVDPKTGTVKVTVALGGQRGLRPGLYVDVDLVTATHGNALLVPKRALVYDNDQMFVFRVGDDRRAERVLIEAILTDREFVEPGEGLAVGDQVIIAGQTGLKDGALVRLPGEEPAASNDIEDDDAGMTARASR